MSPKLLAVFVAGALSACASAAPQMSWQPRADANLAADKAACTRIAEDLNVDEAAAYTSGRYGAAAALASRLDESSMKGGTVDRARDAVFEDCMVRKGWQKK